MANPLPPPPLAHPLTDRSGKATQPWARWFQQVGDALSDMDDAVEDVTERVQTLEDSES